MHTRKIQLVSSKLSPSWTLDRMVAVNPFHGFSNQSMVEVASVFKQINGANLFQNLETYRKLYLNQTFDESHIQAALNRSNPTALSVNDVVVDLIRLNDSENKALKTTFTLNASEYYKNDLVQFKVHYFSGWLSYLTATNPNFNGLNLVEEFVAYSKINKSPSIFGIKQFKTYLNEIPVSTYQDFFSVNYPIPDEHQEAHLLGLLYTLPGWASYIRGIDWDNELNGNPTQLLVQFTYTLMFWEYIMFRKHESSGIQSNMLSELKKINLTKIDQLEALKSVLQTALEISKLESLGKKFNAKKTEVKHTDPALAQLVFCIDVRSEVFRRNLEMTAPTIETKGFAGFFGIPVNYRYLGNENTDSNCPVLLKPSILASETANNKAENQTLINQRKNKSFFAQMLTLYKRTPLVSFGFVSPLGLFYLPKIISDSLNFTRPIENKIKLKSGVHVDLQNFGLEEQQAWALATIKNMGFTSFSKLVCFIGHGTETTNNPQNAGLTCGACGGHSGDKNAVVAAAILNKPEVRSYLIDHGIEINYDTYFIPGHHNTTTDEISLINENDIPPVLSKEVLLLKHHLSQARIKSLQERSIRMGIDPTQSQNLELREKDWSEVQPEFGLADCHNFIIANRNRTKEIPLNSTSFLHDYTSKTDVDFKILEGILTAPMIVTTWINLQYYASTIDNDNFGSGNKALHNVINNFGVIEGNNGDLKVGLAKQSVQSLNGNIHEPLRLNVIIDAPETAIRQIAQKHQLVYNLAKNQWINLYCLDEKVGLSYINLADTTNKTQIHFIKKSLNKVV